jgi:hypothetical protein
MCRYRIPAIFCAFALLICELISRPFVNMGIADDGPYISIAHNLEVTGHITYNGWSAAMLGWQLYLGATFIKLFGFSFTAVRMSTLLVAMVSAFLLQRIMVRVGISEWNATLGTLALVLSPLYLLFSVTFMTDIQGLFAIVICLYGCLRALQADRSRSVIGWLCFAVATNAICGTSRQVAWLGVLVMVPSTLWLLRARRGVLRAGILATIVGLVFILSCSVWLKRQPDFTPGDLSAGGFPLVHVLRQFAHFSLGLPFLLLPIVAVFIPEIRKSRNTPIAVLSIVLAICVGFALHKAHIELLQPTGGDWIYGGYGILSQGTPPIFLHRGVRLLITIVSFSGMFGLITSFWSERESPPVKSSPIGSSWKQLGVLLVPFTVAYTLLLTFRAITIYGLFDRYALVLLVVAVVCLVRYYQDQVQLRLPLLCVLLVAVCAVYGVSMTHNTFALYRARVAFAAELKADGISETSVDNGWEYNVQVELEHARHINNPGIVLPATDYVPTPPLPAGTCPMPFFDETPHVRPLYGISFDPNACYGPAPFAPIHYSRWLVASPGTLYAVRYTPASKP